MENIDYTQYKNWLSSSGSKQEQAVYFFCHNAKIVDTEVDNILMSLLKTEEDKDVRRNLMRLFVERADKKFLQLFFDTLQDDDCFVCGNAYKGLRKLGVNENHELLVDYRNHSNHSFEHFCINETAEV